MLQLNTSSYDQVTLINKALSNDSNGVYLIDCGKGSDSFQTKKELHDSLMIMKTESISMRDLMYHYHLSKLDFVKMDIEGAEAYCITKNAMDWISSTETLAIEIHEHIAPGTNANIKELLGVNFKISQQGEYSVFTKSNSFDST